MTIVAKLAGPFPEILEHNFNDAPDFTKVQVIIVNKKILEKNSQDNQLLLTLTDTTTKTDFQKLIDYTEINDEELLLELTSLGDKKLVINELIYLNIDFKYIVIDEQEYNKIIYNKYHKD